MDYKSLSALLLRVAGVIILVSAVGTIPSTFVKLYDAKSATADVMVSWLLTVSAVGVPILVGLALIYFPMMITNQLLHTEGESTIDLSRLEQLAFSVLGVYFVANALLDGFHWIAELRLYFVFYEEMAPVQPFRLPPRSFADIAASCLQLIIGLFLLFGGPGLASLVQRLRGPRVEGT